MSGTSIDGLDCSFMTTDGENLVSIKFEKTYKYSQNYRNKLKKIIKYLNKKRLIKINQYAKNQEGIVTNKFIQIIKKFIKEYDIKYSSIDYIGISGQTVFHDPKNKKTIQFGSCKKIQKKIKLKIVGNFRENDILNGGQGAPLASIYHQLILSRIKSKPPSAFINIGGISNITYIDKYNKVVSFDTGPGNYLIDEWVRIKAKKEFDRDGLIAKSGQIDEEILKKYLSDLYYKKKFPKSLDVKDFNLQNLNKLSLKDGCATLSMLTARSICIALNSFKKKPNLVLISGGGRKNKYIIDNIKKKFTGSVKLIDDFSFNGDFIESQAFAYLAIRSYLKKFITFPSTTGVRKPCLGGSVFKS